MHRVGRHLNRNRRVGLRLGVGDRSWCWCGRSRGRLGLILPLPLGFHEVLEQLGNRPAALQRDFVGPLANFRMHGEVQFSAEGVFGFATSNLLFS